MTRRNQYPENPWPPGSGRAQWWDLGKSASDVVDFLRSEAVALAYGLRRNDPGAWTALLKFLTLELALVTVVLIVQSLA